MEMKTENKDSWQKAELDLLTDDEKGLVTNLQDYSVHDGYGLRLLLFLKGCPLRCKWCQNPETVKSHVEIEYRSALCQRCGECFKVCPVEGAIIDPATTEDKTRRIDRDKCTNCGLCCKACPQEALATVGELMTVGQIMDKVERLIPFYKGSGQGGLTISGGEPLFQPKFTWKLLKSCTELGVHTAIETCGFVKYEILESMIPYLDLMLFDIKHIDDESHKKGTGQSNKLILENLTRFVSENNTECVVRLPLIPGFNDDEENVRRTAQFLSSLKRPPRLDLLSFNDYASSKYKVMGLEHVYQYAGAKKQPIETLKKLLEIAKLSGLEVTTEGLW
jgi:pyruvate formate lyase activating enzyme